MGFFSNLFGHKSEAKNHSILGQSKPDFELYEKVIDSIVETEILNTDLKTKIKQSIEDPKSFYNYKNDFILSERGLTYPKDKSLTSKFVLVDSLIEARQMTEVDWKEDEEEVRLWINEIAKTKDFKLNLSTEKKYGNETLEVIQSIDKYELRPLSYAIEILDIDSDSYVFTIIPLDRQNEVQQLFAKLK
jgi:uncharacterized protein involved in tolerance to divalent cations